MKIYGLSKEIVKDRLALSKIAQIMGLKTDYHDDDDDRKMFTWTSKFDLENLGQGHKSLFHFKSHVTESSTK